LANRLVDNVITASRATNETSFANIEAVGAAVVAMQYSKGGSKEIVVGQIFVLHLSQSFRLFS
jgi:hypothetical protein